MIQTISLHGVVVEPWARTRFPLQAANHAELSPAAACHMITAFLQLDGGGAVIAALPTFFLRDLGESLRRLILGAVTA